MVSVYVSYAWKDEEQNRLVDKLEEACAARKIDLLRDKEQVPYAGSNRAFMGRVGKGKHVVVVLSAAYLKSPYCMYELREIYWNGNCPQPPKLPIAAWINPPKQENSPTKTPDRHSLN